MSEEDEEFVHDLLYKNPHLVVTPGDSKATTNNLFIRPLVQLLLDNPEAEIKRDVDPPVARGDILKVRGEH